MRHKLISLMLIGWCGLAHAASIEQPLPDPAQEATARTIFHELKCVVCEGQALADSDAALAREMRAHVRKRLAAGDTREQVLAFFRTRYGDQILMTPPLQPSTWLLWIAPLIILLAGAWLLRRATRDGDTA